MANMVSATFSASDRQKRNMFRSDINDFCPKDCLCLSEIQVELKAYGLEKLKDLHIL